MSDIYMEENSRVNMNKYTAISLLLVYLLILSCDYSTDHSDESDLVLEIEKINSTREYDSENDQYTYTAVDTVEYIFDNIDLNSLDISNASEIHIDNPSNSYNIFVETDIWVSRDLKVFVLFKDNDEGFTNVIALSRNQGIAVFSSGGSNTFSGTLYGFFIEALCDQENIVDNNFNVNISSGNYESVLVVNVLDNMINPEFNFSYIFDESANENLFFNYSYSANIINESNFQALIIFENFNDSYEKSILTFTTTSGIGGTIQAAFKTTNVYVLGLNSN